jgi:predicted double-glycine peptidase
MIYSRLYSKMTCQIFGCGYLKMMLGRKQDQMAADKGQVISEQNLSGFIKQAGLVLLLLLFSFYLPTCQSSDIRLPGAFSGGMTYKKKVVSMREARYSEMIPQKTDFSCGAAALATILRYGYGEDITEQQIIKAMLKLSDPAVIKKKGFSLLDLKKYVHTRGMRAHGYKVNLNALAKLKIPVIVLLDTGGYQHFVVVKKARNGKVHVSDPALGNKIIPGDKFTQGWNGIVFAVVGKPIKKDSPLLEANGPFQVEKERMLNTVQRRIDATDFGLIPNQMF